MDSKKLEDLRARYAAATAGQSHDPEFRKIIEQVFAGTDRRPKPYEGVSTLLGAPLRVDADLGGLDAALGAREPLGLVHIDAHCDTGGPFEGSKFHHGGPFRQAVLAGVLDPERTIQIGIRGGAEYLWEFSYASGMTVIHAEELQREGLARTIDKIRKVVVDGPTYVSFDVDSLDPAFAPGTGTPEVGGLSTREAMELVRGCAGLDIVGGDVVEVAPQYDATSNTAQAAAQMLFEIAALTVLARKQRV